jgi:hypothetical protein
MIETRRRRANEAMDESLGDLGPEEAVMALLQYLLAREQEARSA